MPTSYSTTSSTTLFVKNTIDYHEDRVEAMKTMEETSSVQQLKALLWSIVSTAFASLVLSVRLVFRETSNIARRRALPPSSRAGKRGAISLYKGIVWHERRSPCLHEFSYTVRYALVNLDHAPPSFTSSTAHNHINASEARSISGTAGPVYLLTVPSSVGYEQNPLSVYYCFNDDETHLSVCIAEVTNTPWGERVTFLFDPNGDTVAKPLHVSPFMDMLGVWRIEACVPDQTIRIKITVQHPDHGKYFTASLCLSRVECPQTSVERFFWLMPHKTALGIYWQALLLWLKSVNFCQHPKYVDGDAYKGRAIERDQEILSRSEEERTTKLRDTIISPPCILKGSSLKCTRSYAWCEAQWPWK